MDRESLLIKSDSHLSKLADVLSSLRLDRSYVDTTLVCSDGQTIPAHRLVLVAASPLLRRLLLQQLPLGPQPIVMLSEVSARDLRAVLSYVYNGEVRVPHGQLASFMKAAEVLQVDGLAAETYSNKIGSFQEIMSPKECFMDDGSAPTCLPGQNSSTVRGSSSTNSSANSGQQSSTSVAPTLNTNIFLPSNIGKTHEVCAFSSSTHQNNLLENSECFDNNSKIQTSKVCRKLCDNSEFAIECQQGLSCDSSSTTENVDAALNKPSNDVVLQSGPSVDCPSVSNIFSICSASPSESNANSDQISNMNAKLRHTPLINMQLVQCSTSTSLDNTLSSDLPTCSNPLLNTPLSLPIIPFQSSEASTSSMKSVFPATPSSSSHDAGETLLMMKTEPDLDESQLHDNYTMQEIVFCKADEELAGYSDKEMSYCDDEDDDEQDHDEGSPYHKTDPAFNIATYEIPVQNFPVHLQQGLDVTCRNNERLPLNLRRLLIRVVSDDLHLKVQQPGRFMLKEVAKKLVRQYPVLQDVVDTSGTVIGTGYNSIVTNLVTRFETMNRNLRSKKSKGLKETESHLGQPSVDSKRAYGCNNFAPKISPEQYLMFTTMISKLKNEYNQSNNSQVSCNVHEQMKIIFPMIRHRINSKVPLPAIMGEIPLLFAKTCFFDHFSMLTSCQPSKSRAVFEAKFPRLLKFVCRNPRVNSRAINCGLPAVDLLNSLSIYVGDDPEFLFLQYHEVSPATVRKYGDHPHIVALAGGGYSINVGGQILFREASPFDAVMLLLGCYFVFALPYPYEAGATLEFIQRYFLKINPASGSKIAIKPGKKKTTSAHPKVLSLIYALNADESSYS